LNLPGEFFCCSFIVKNHAMIRIFLILPVLLFHVHSLFSQNQVPAWVSAEKRQAEFPDGKYLTGFDSQVIRKTDNLQEVQKNLLENAKIYLVQSIRTIISASATINTENRNSSTQEIFKQSSSSFSQADLSGLKVNEFYDRKKKEAYAFVHLNIQDFILAEQNTLNAESIVLEKKIEAARQYFNSGNRPLALKTYLECFPILREMESRMAVILTLGNPEVSIPYSALSDSVSRAIASLRTGPRNTIEDLCLFISDGLKQQIPENFTETIRMGSFTYMDSHIGSCFSTRLSASLQPGLIENGFGLYYPDQTSKDHRHPWALNGTYWPDGANLKVIVSLSNEKSGKTIASVEDFLPLKWLTEREIEYIPQNHQSIEALEKELSKDEIVKPGLMVSLWTNKGDNPVYRSGETMKVFAQVDRPCFIRLIYYTADGQHWLLDDSQFLDEEKVNKPVLLGEFECTPPFGAEILQLVAQTVEFARLNTQKSGRDEIILDDDRTTIQITRGMQKKQPDIQIAEKRTNITTVEK